MVQDIREKLKTEVVSVGEILDNTKKHKFVIPNFQRDYSWTEEQVEELLNDIIDSFHNIKTNENEFYFLGTVQLAKLDNYGYLSIIDGQQRLITLSIIIKVLNEKINDKNCKIELTDIIIKNNETNQKYYKDILSGEDIIDNANENNLFLKNYIYIKNYLKNLDDDEKSNNFERDLLSYICNNVVLMEIISDNELIPLSKVLKIFDSLNTKGMDLNTGDIFKVRFAEYLQKKTSKGYDDLLCEINACYEKISKLNDEIEREEYLYENIWSMDDVLLIYQHIIIAKKALSLEWLKKSREKFFEDLFKENDCDLLTLEDLQLIVDIVCKMSKWKNNLKVKNKFELFCKHSNELIGWTRYWRCWTCSYVSMFFALKNHFNEKESKEFNDLTDIEIKGILNIEYSLAKFLTIYSANYSRVLDSVYKYYIKALFDISELTTKSDNDIASIEELRDSIIKDFIDKADKYYPAEGLKGDNGQVDIFYNNVKTGITGGSICWWVSLFQEINAKGNSNLNKIEESFFKKKKYKDKDKDEYDIEHIYPQKMIEELRPEAREMYYGIGNLMLLESGINRSIQDNMSEKFVQYNESKFDLPREIVREHSKNGEIKWTKADIENRYNFVKEMFDNCFVHQETFLNN